MTEPNQAIIQIRDAVCALLRVRAGEQENQYHLSLVGTIWSVAPGIFVTAQHTLNGGDDRQPEDKFYILRAPGNGQILQHWRVTAFNLEDRQRDLAILEAPLPEGIDVPIIPVAADPPADGTPVLTYGCPSPTITGANVSDQGDLVGIQTVLFTHANTGIVAAQYQASPTNDVLFEFNVGWHHGESGGPVIQLEPTVAAISVMQHYRNIQGPHGVMAGPRRGRALGSIQASLENVGATFV